MNIILTTDTHFNHSKLIDFGRPKDFESKIKTWLINNVKPEDLLIHLGDVCIGNDKENNNWFKNNIGCRTWLLRGNHDNKSVSWYLENGWDMCAERLDLKMYGKRICFSHIPKAWDGYFDINIHGHFHDVDKRRYQSDFMDIYCGYNKLLSMEATEYKGVYLKNFLTK
jgi:calcineurin-like phosphoesterase family protein